MKLKEAISRAYRAALFCRQDPQRAVGYLSAEDFPGLIETPYPVASSGGYPLSGRFYEYDGAIEGRVVVFEHGMGPGHRAYMREIELLASHGYRVFTYDHSGCAESGGEGCGGFGRSLCDLTDCMRALLADPALEGVTFSVIGHSWGGYSTMNIGTLSDRITHLVAMSGFASVERMVKQQFSGLMTPSRSLILDMERRANPNTFSVDGAQSLKETKAKVLLIHSPDDPLVSYRRHFKYLMRQLEGQENVSFLTVPKGKHNPSYTLDAIAYKDRFLRELGKLNSRPTTEAEQDAFRESWDWMRMTEQSDEVWNLILEHLSK